MTRKEAVDYIAARDGRIFSVRFRKRSTGEIREMVCRQKVKKALVENPSKPGTDFKANGLIAVYDMVKKEYRSIPIEGIRELKIDGSWRKVIDA